MSNIISNFFKKTLNKEKSKVNKHEVIKKNQKEITNNNLSKKEQEYYNKISKNHVQYKYTFDNDKINLYLEDDRLSNPILFCEHGEITAKQIRIENQWIFQFGIDNLPLIDAVASKILIIDGDSQYYLSSYHKNAKINYSRVYDILYGKQYIYYLRNTASKVGRLVIQKKPRAYFETPEYEQRIERIYHETRNVKCVNVLFYEKYGSKFEESASTIFSRVAHLENVYFVLDRHSEQYEVIKEKYGQKILSPDEDRFIYKLFTSSYYIGTEVPFHMVTLRTPYSRFRTEILNTKKHKFIFLQHGVMYALSMKPASRNSFKKNGIHAPFRMVASSELEAQHLKELGSYKYKDIWKTGLSTFDGKKINSDANKITLMLTWRPWDEQKESFEETTYYQAVKSIIDTIEDKTNFQLVLHPKVLEVIDDDNELLKYKYNGLINDALNETKVLISDYSSVTFDAFYRGINVIFWWKDKVECLEKYNNHLMLNDENIFGDVVVANHYLNNVIDFNYNNPQQKQYIDNYRKIVEFHDNHNTDRIIEFMFTETVFNYGLEFKHIQKIRQIVKDIEPFTSNYGRLKMAYINELSHERLVSLEVEIKNEIIYNLIKDIYNAETIEMKNMIIDEYEIKLHDYYANRQVLIEGHYRNIVKIRNLRRKRQTINQQIDRIENRNQKIENQLMDYENDCD